MYPVAARFPPFENERAKEGETDAGKSESVTVTASANRPLRSVVFTGGTGMVRMASLPWLIVNDVWVSDRPRTRAVYLILSAVTRSVSPVPTLF